MIIKNILPQLFEVLVNGKKYSFPAGSSVEVPDTDAKWVLRAQPLLVKEEPESVKIEGEPEKIKVKNNVVKNKKSRK